MTDREQTQADLLDQFRQNRDGNPPDGLDSGVASIAVMLEEHLSPGAPSALFVRNLGRRLYAESNRSGNHRQATVPPLLPDQTIPPSAPPNTLTSSGDDEPRRSWMSEAARIAAAGLAIALVGIVLLLIFRNADDAAAPGAGETAPPGPEAIPTTEASPDRLYVVTSNGVTAADPATGDEIYSIDAGFSPDAALSPDGSRLYVAGAGGVDDLVAIDAASGDEVWRTQVEDRIQWIGGQGPSTLAVSPDGSRIYLYSSNAPDVHWVQIIDAITGSFVARTSSIIQRCAADMHVSPDGNTLYAVCIRFGSLAAFDLDSLEVLPLGLIDKGSIAGAVVSSDGYLYVIVGNSATYRVVVIQMDERRIVREVEHGGPLLPAPLYQLVSLAPDGTRLYVALGTEDNDGDSGTQDVREIAVFDTTTWEEIDRLTLDVPLKNGAFTMSPDGQYIYASERLQLDSDGKLIRIDVETGEVSTVLVRNAEILRVLTASRNASSPPQPESIPTPEKIPAPSVGDPIDLPFNLNRTNTSKRATLVEANGPPPISQEEAMQTVADDFPWGLGGEWEGETVTIDAWYGIGTIGSEIQDRAMWLIDYGNVQGIIASGCPGCTPPPVYNHNVYAIDAQTGELIWWASYSDGTVPNEAPIARLAYEDQSQVGEFAYGCGWAGDPICADSAGLLFPEQVMRVPAGTELTFTIDSMSDLVNVQASAFLLNDDAHVDDLQGKPFLIYPPPPASGLAVSPSSTEPKFAADLPPGEYAISVDVRNSSSESATYGFHIAIPDEMGNVPPGIETEPFEPAEFDRYPVWSLGDTFGEFVLDRIKHRDISGNDSVEYSYIAGDGRTDVGIVIVSQGPLSETELRARQGIGEPVVINGVEGWMTPVDDNARTIELDLDGGHLTIFATDQETALAAAEAVQQVNGP